MSQYSYPDQERFGSPQPKPGMSGLKIALIIGGICLFLLVVAVVVIGFFASRLFVDSKEMKTVVSNDNITEIDVPSNWSEITGPDRNPEASLQYCNLFAETYGLILTEPKTDFVFQSGNYTLDDYTELMVLALENESFRADSIAPTKVTVNGLNARRIRFKTGVDGIPIVYFATAIEGQGYFHQVHCWTLESREERNLPTLMKVSNSFRER